jgi:hypothetical protein
LIHLNNIEDELKGLLFEMFLTVVTSPVSLGSLPQKSNRKRHGDINELFRRVGLEEDEHPLR